MRCPTYVNGDNINGFGKRDVHCVGAFKYDHSWITPELPGERTVAGIDGVDPNRTTLQKAVDEPADLAAQVSADTSGDIHPKMIERRRQLFTAAGDVTGPTVHSVRIGI